MMYAIESSMQAQVASAQEEMARMEIAELNRKCQCFSFVYFHATTFFVYSILICILLMVYIYIMI